MRHVEHIAGFEAGDGIIFKNSGTVKKKAYGKEIREVIFKDKTGELTVRIPHTFNENDLIEAYKCKKIYLPKSGEKQQSQSPRLLFV